MAEPKTGEIGWFSPDPRAIFDLNEFHIPRSLKLVIKKGIFEIRVDTCFEEVMRACGKREETWISDDLVQTYLRLFTLGFAHSIESWKDGKLVGGLYGVAIGGAFFGESMFSEEQNASKVALVHLVERMKIKGYTLLDTQWTTPHLKMFGAKEVSRNTYLGFLKEAVEKQCFFL